MTLQGVRPDQIDPGSWCRSRTSSPPRPGCARRTSTTSMIPLAQPEAQGLFRPPHRHPGNARRRRETAVRERRHALGVRPVYKRVDTCAAEFATAPPTCTRPTRTSARRVPTDPQEDHGARRRSQPHRPGHRVRLLLRACGAGDARGRLRDHHGQLQSGNRVHRLRHLRPPLLRAGDAGRHARNRPCRAADRRHRPVRRPDAAQAWRANWKPTACRSSAPAPT
jgi:hypothetical protein